MPRSTARLMAGLFVAASALVAQPVLAQQPPMRDLLGSSYGLWGMMDAMANFCWERSGYEVGYMEAHQNWLARSVFIRDEIDAALAASGEAATLAADGEKTAADSILEIMRQADNKDAACASWLGEVERSGAFEPETFLAYQLGLLRERDGL